MASLLLGVIYLIFVSLGLPDSLLGSGWLHLTFLYHMPATSQ